MWRLRAAHPLSLRLCFLKAASARRVEVTAAGYAFCGTFQANTALYAGTSRAHQRGGSSPSAVPAHRGGGLAYISQQSPAARRRSAGREARGCSRRAEPWPVSGGARRGGAGRGRCSPQGPVRAAPGAGCGPGRRGVAEQRLPRGSLGGGEPRV